MAKNIKKSEELSKKDRVDKEIKRLINIFRKMPRDKFDTLEGIIEEAANIRMTMQDMRKELDATGWVDLFQQSNDVEPYERTRPLANQYNSLNKNYQNLMKMLKESLPKDEPTESGDSFDDFVNDRDD
jgi:hypothetical protein